MPPAKLGLVYSHTGLRRFIDAIGAARTRELFLLGRYIDAPTALAWGLVNRLAPAAELEAAALELAAELAGNAPLSQLGNKRVIAELLGAEGELLGGGRGGADRAAPRILRLAGHARGNEGLRRETPPALARGVASAALRNVNLQQTRRGRSQMPPLITREEALQLGEIEDHAQIEALIGRAWEARVERFADSTDMCSLVNAKSGGCAEDCGFCAQSRFAEAETPLHAMMEPEQVLEHARAAEAAGAHRFCMVTQGQGLSKRDFEKYLRGRPPGLRAHQPEALRLGRAHLHRTRAGAEGGGHPARAPQRRDGRELLRRGLHHRPLRGPSAHDRGGARVGTGDLRRAASSTSARVATQRVEMAFELAAIDPTSVPINMLNPRPGTKFGDREYMDPWEAVKWIAIFRLILPEALFRLCGGRVENLGELQALAVKAGINGVMMGNFLTTLGNEPEQDRAMFEEHGLNVARHPDNASKPAPGQPLGMAGGRDAGCRRGAARTLAAPRRRST